MNIICRGGIAQTRPGSKSIIELPSGTVQGMTIFKPTTGVHTLVSVIDGNVYACPAPFDSYYQIAGLKFSKYSKFIAWASCIQSVELNPAGELVVMESPKAVLMIADGNTRTGFWDGSVAGHLNPEINETPVGLWMSWSNNRLWISRGSQVFASDLGNPLSFTDQTYFAEGRAFYLPDDCTGIAETSDRQGIICFTASTGTYIKSSVQDRTTWLSTPQFIQTILPGVGCVAPRSIVQQYGLLWWYSSSGLISQDDAERLYISSRISIADNEMAESKAFLSADLSSTCGVAFENFLLHAVPHAGRLNNRIHVLDQAPFEDQKNAWAGYWTGWNFIEMVSDTINGQKRVFGLSADAGDKNRIWELFKDEKRDNGIPITCFIVTRAHHGDNLDYKDFRYAEIELCNLEGEIALTCGVRGTRGAFQRVLTKDIIAGYGQIYHDEDYGYNASELASTRLQIRTIKSKDDIMATDCNSVKVETEMVGLTDKAFTLVIAWSGVLGVSAYRIFMQTTSQSRVGDCEQDETQDRIISGLGCGSETRIENGNVPFEEFYAKVRYTATDGTDTVTRTSIQSSFINQQDATRKATATAKWLAYDALGIV